MYEYKPESLYILFSQVMKLHFHRAHNLLDKIGVYPGQPPLLISLVHKDGQSQKELAERISIKPATITVMISRLEKTGLVERRQDAEDQRISRVFLTEKGRNKCMEVGNVMNSINAECFSNFNEEEKALLRRFFMQMKDNLEKVTGKSGDCER